MNHPLAALMERNLFDVFGERGLDRRKTAIAEIYTEDCSFSEADERIIGREALNGKIERILEDSPGFVFRAAGPAQVTHDLGRLQWQFGPPGSAAVVTGMDVALFEDARIRHLYTFLDPRASVQGDAASSTFDGNRDSIRVRHLESAQGKEGAV